MMGRGTYNGRSKVGIPVAAHARKVMIGRVLLTGKYRRGRHVGVMAISIL